MKNFPFGFFGLIAAALAAGIAGDLLLRAGILGAGFSLWATAVLALVAWLAPRENLPTEPLARVPLAAAMAFSVLFSWRDAGPLKLLLLAVILGSIALTAAATAGRSLRAAFVWDYVVDLCNGVLLTLSLPFTAFVRTPPPLPGQGRTLPPAVAAALRGVLLALPPLFIFGSLLVSADAAFEQIVFYVFDFEKLVSHTGISVACAWFAAAVWVLCLIPGMKPPLPRSGPDARFRWGIIEINVALGLVTALFAAFLLVQAQHLFGGAPLLRQPAGSHSAYARRGFFELAWVAAIALALLVNCARAQRAAGPVGNRAFKFVSAAMVLCVLCIIASALYKMGLYIEVYGLTRLRLYTACFMIWMAVVFAWLYFCLWRERVRSFAWGFLLSGYAATLLLLALNPDARIASVNMDRAQEGKVLATPHGAAGRAGGELDTQYIGDLSADAIPVIVSRLEAMTPAVQSVLRLFLADRSHEYDQRPLRTWTLGLHSARAVLESKDVTPSSPQARKDRSPRNPAK